jgi:hypothetical protein
MNKFVGKGRIVRNIAMKGRYALADQYDSRDVQPSFPNMTKNLISVLRKAFFKSGKCGSLIIHQIFPKAVSMWISLSVALESHNFGLLTRFPPLIVNNLTPDCFTSASNLLFLVQSPEPLACGQFRKSTKGVCITSASAVLKKVRKSSSWGRFFGQISQKATV